jgi:hypothetical protein
MHLSMEAPRMSENADAEPEKSSGIRRLINAGAEIAGGAVGGALGFLAGGPAGAALFGAGGAAAAMALKHIGQEASERLLGPREAVRVGGVLAIAAGEIRQRIEQGERVRTDGFFERNRAGRSDAEEFAESVLLKSKREPEEKKIPYMAHLLSSVAFDPEISADMAHQITKAAEQLTYRQLCLMKLAVVKDGFGLRTADYRGQASFPKGLYQILYECLDLYHRGFVNFGGEVAFGPTDVAPGKMTLQGLGVDIFSLMKLALIPNEGLAPVAAQLT